MAGLVAVLREFFGPDGLGVGVDLVGLLDCDNGDNGVYQVGEGWAIVDRWGMGTQSLELTMAELHGRELDHYQGIVAQLAEAFDVQQVAA
jgi:hypothetical protein